MDITNNPSDASVGGDEDVENQGLGGEEVTTARETSTLRQYRSSTWG